MKTIISLLLIIAVSGCAKTQTYAPQAKPSMPSYVANRLTTHLVSVTAPVTITNNPLQVCNLNVALEAIVNPKKETLFSPSDVQDILDRSETRIKAAALDIMTYNPIPHIGKIKELKNNIRNVAQATFDKMYQQWEYADDYQVEIVVTSMSINGYGTAAIYSSR